MQFLVVVLAGFGAGFINALAGGGSFLTFPSLIAAGLPAIDANASSTIALFPGAGGDDLRLSRRLEEIPRRPAHRRHACWRSFRWSADCLGALLLLATPDKPVRALDSLPARRRDARFRFRHGHAEGYRKTAARADRRAGRASFRVDLWRLFRRRHRHSDAGGADPLRTARHRADEQPENAARVADERYRHRRLPVFRQGPLAGGGHPVGRLHRRRLRGRACRIAHSAALTCACS